MSENRDIAQILAAVADLLDLAGERFKPEAYRRAARSLEALPEPVSVVERRGELEQIPGIGEAIAEKIREYLKTGHIAYYERLRREFPAGLIDLMQLPGIGPKTARRFWTELGVEGPGELGRAIDAGRLDGMKGFGPKKIEQFRAAVVQKGPARARLPLAQAAAIAQEIVDALRAQGGVEEVEVAGSLRRRRETVGDLDVLATSPEPESVLRAFTHLPQVRSVLLAGGTKATVLYHDSLQVDLRVVEPRSFGAAWQYFTGSKDHNIHLRTIARDQGLKINEYGVFQGDEWLAGRTEEEVYARLGLSWMPPEIREDHGEIEAALRHAVPTLVTARDVRGLLHVHLGPETDSATVDRWVKTAGQRGWGYLGVVPAAPPTQGSGEPASPKALARLDHHRTATGSVRVLLAHEGPRPPAAGSAASSIPVDYWILDLHQSPGSETGGDERSETPWVAAHPPEGLDPGATLAALRGVRPSPRAIEVSPDPGVDGFDSSVVQPWVSAGGDVVVSPGGEDPMDERRLELALGVARRGWTTPDRLLNGRPFVDLVSSGRPRARRAT